MITLLWLISACSGPDTSADDTDDGGLPARLYGSGVAASAETDPYPRADCSFWFYGEELSAAGDTWIGTLTAGEVIRNAYDEVNGGQFQAIVAGTFTLERTDDAVTLYFVGDQPTDAAPFWLALEAIPGTAESADSFTGTWTCAPLDVDYGNFVDDAPSIPGTWTLEPS